MTKLQLDTIQSRIDALYESRPESPRAHLGCSLLGHHCDRWLWLSFRWAVIEKFPGRILRLFKRGQMEEATITANLRAIGIDVRDAQQRVNFGKFVSGSLDGIAKSGIPEAPHKAHIVEYKTHSLKSFNDLEKEGVEKSKPQHWAQMQLYMAGTEIDRALYVAVCKDDDRIYTERVRFDKEAANNLIARGHRIAMSERMPEPCSTDSTWYQCRVCPAHDMCFGSKTTKQVNCRTCALSTPCENSTFTCARYDNAEIPTDAQVNGCECHVLHPDMVPWQRHDSPSDWIAMYEIDGKMVQNGEPDANVFSSKELLADAKACANADAFVREARIDLGGRIAGPC
jgi:hypothetical protein